MKKTNMARQWVLWLAPIFLAALLAGCGPRPESVLEGTWELTTDDDQGLIETLLTFNHWGRLSEITFRNDMVSITNDVILRTKSTVVGNAVSLDTSVPGCSLIFRGTLNEDQTVIAGTVTMELQISLLNITIDKGAATLTRH